LTSDLDQSGNAYQQAKVYLGPSLGWVMQQVKPEKVVGAGTIILQPGDSLIMAHTDVGPITVQLPDVVPWIREAAYQPMTGFERAIWIKDVLGNANVNNITVTPFGTQTIDLQSSFTIISSFAMIRLYPLFDLTGWFRG
jgi:hypothetical protein